MKAIAFGRNTAMQHYKNYSIYITGVASQGGGWHPRGLVFDPEAKPTIEIKRLDASDLFCFTKQEAEELALMLCRSWVDGLRLEQKTKS